MAEYDKGRFYWIKLTDRFMTSDTVDFLMEQKDGANYVVLYQMLCLKTVNNGGVLARVLGEILVPYDIEKIQRDCKWFSIDTVRIALELYKGLGLIYENKDGMLAISEFERLVGSQSYGAEKKELQKKRRENNLLQGGTKVEYFPLEKEIEKEKEIREEEKEKEKEFQSFIHTGEKEYIQRKIEESDLEGSDAEVYKSELKESLKQRFFNGTLGKGVVFMSDEQFQDLLDKLGVQAVDKYFGIVAEEELKGHHYKKKTHYQAILDMAMKDRRIKQ